MAAAALPLLMSAIGTAGAAAGTAGTLATIASVASAGMSIFSGVQAYRAGRAEEAQYKMQAEYTGLQAKQEEANRQSALTKVLNTQMATVAMSGGQVGSGTDLAIADFSKSEAARESRIATMDTKFKQGQQYSQARQAVRTGQAGLISGFTSAANTAISGFNNSAQRTKTT